MIQKKAGLTVLLFSSLGISTAYAQAVYQQPPVMMQQPPVVMQQPPVVVAQPYCAPYADTLTIGRESRITRGVACLQPDGAWELRPTNAPVNYIMRGHAIYAMPLQPFAVVVGHARHHHYHHDHDRD